VRAEIVCARLLLGNFLSFEQDDAAFRCEPKRWEIKSMITEGMGYSIAALQALQQH
jgi:hypothetical protein